MSPRSDPFLRPAPTRRLRCIRCGHEWAPRKPNPQDCPKCGDKWNEARTMLKNGEGKWWTCQRCGCRWQSRLKGNKRPVRCTGCHNGYWWKPGRRGKWVTGGG